MTARKNATRPLLQAPQNDPLEITTAIVTIPDSDEYKRTLLGLIKVASVWLNYERSGTNREAVVASQWRDIYMNISFDICARIVECIENNQDVQDALRELNEQQGLPNNNPNSKVGTDDGNVLEGVGCDNDSIYGAMVAVEDYIHEVSLDFLEVVSNAPSAVSALARLTDWFPILGDFPVLDDLSEIVDWIRTEGISSYNAGYTTTMRQDNICGLFELACATCSITPTQIAQYYGSLGGVNFDENTLWLVVIGLLTNITGNQVFAYGIHSFVASVLAVGGNIKGLKGLIGLQNIAKSGNPDSDWFIFCDGCNEPTCIDDDFNLGNKFDWYAVQAVWSTNQWGAITVSGSKHCVIEKVIETPSVISIEVDYFASQACGLIDFCYVEVVYNGTSQKALTLEGRNTHKFDIPIQDIDTLRVRLIRGNSTTATANIHGVEVCRV